MKTYIPHYLVLSSIALLPILGLFSCAPSVSTTPPIPAGTTISPATLSLVQTGATVATGVVLNLAEKSASERTQLANQIYASASALYTLTGGAVPSPAVFNSTLASYGVTGVSQYTQYTQAIDALYAAYFDKYTAGSISAQNVLAVINALATGAEAGASSYSTLPAQTTSMYLYHLDIRPPHGSIRQESAYDLTSNN